MDQLSFSLYKEWDKIDPLGTQKILCQDQCDIAPEFMCFCDIYFHLSKIIPLHWTVVDLGCAFAPQCWYFRHHKKYIGVNPGDFKRFKTENCSHFEGSIKEFISDQQKSSSLDLDRTFGIMSYVPAQEYEYFLAKSHLTNIFVYYPSSDPIKLNFRTDDK